MTWWREDNNKQNWRKKPYLAENHPRNHLIHNECISIYKEYV